MKRSYYVSKVKDKTSIKIVKFNKDLNITKNLKQIRALIKNHFDTEEIHVQIILVNKKVKIFNFFFKEFQHIRNT